MRRDDLYPSPVQHIQQAQTIRPAGNTDQDGLEWGWVDGKGDVFHTIVLRNFYRGERRERRVLKLFSLRSPRSLRLMAEESKLAFVRRPTGQVFGGLFVRAVVGVFPGAAQFQGEKLLDLVFLFK